jgi:hypothetical protein
VKYSVLTNYTKKKAWLPSVLLSYIDTSRGDSITLGVLSGIIAVNEYQEK